MTNVEVLSLQKAEAVVILPAYREASRVAPEGFGLGPTIENYQKALEGEYGNAYGLVVVDDGSDDDTAEFAQNLGAQTISYETNRGRGHALKVGFLAVTSAMSDLDKKSVGYFDADGSYSSDTMLRLLDTTLSRKTDIAVAYRLEGADQHESRMRRIAHYGLNKVCETIAPTGTKDVNAGAKAFRADIARELWQQASLERWGADREVLYLARQMGLKMLEIDAKITPVGDSRVKLIRDTFGRLSNSVEIRKRFARSA